MIAGARRWLWSVRQQESARRGSRRFEPRAWRTRWMLLAIALVALLLRCAVMLITRHSYALINDAADYSRLGTSIAAGHGFGVSHVAPGGGPTALRPPAFPLLLAAVYSIVGVHVLAARIAAAVLGAIAAVLVGALIQQSSGDPRKALAGGLLAAVYPPMVIASTSVMSEALFVPLSLGVIAAALAYRHDPRIGWLAISGLLLGCATLTRPVGAVLVLPAVLIAFGGQPKAPRRVTAALTAAVLAIAPCAAWEIRDVSVLHHVVPLTTQSGYLLAGTYNATSAHYRPQPGVWMVPTRDPAIARLVAAHPHAPEVRLGDMLQTAAMRYLNNHPTYILTVVGHNLLRMFDFTSRSFDQAVVYGEYGFGSAFGTAEYVSALAMFALAVVGLMRRGARGWPIGLWLAPVLLVLVTIPVQSYSRFRAPVDPYLVILASAAIAPRARSVPR